MPAICQHPRTGTGRSGATSTICQQVLYPVTTTSQSYASILTSVSLTESSQTILSLSRKLGNDHSFQNTIALSRFSRCMHEWPAPDGPSYIKQPIRICSENYSKRNEERVCTFLFSQSILILELRARRKGSVNVYHVVRFRFRSQQIVKGGTQALGASWLLLLCVSKSDSLRYFAFKITNEGPHIFECSGRRRP